MRLLTRPGLPVVIVLLAVLAHVGFGVSVSCASLVPDRTAPVAKAAVAHAMADATVVPDQCTSERPCQHDPMGRHGAAEAAARSHDVPRSGAPAIVAPALVPSRPQPPSAPMAGPVPPAAVIAPVAVLCVDRN